MCPSVHDFCVCSLLPQIQSAILGHTWQWDTKEKDKALVAKQEQLEEAYVHEEEMRKKQEQVERDTGNPWCDGVL